MCSRITSFSGVPLTCFTPSGSLQNVCKISIFNSINFNSHKANLVPARVPKHLSSLTYIYQIIKYPKLGEDVEAELVAAEYIQNLDS